MAIVVWFCQWATRHGTARALRLRVAALALREPVLERDDDQLDPVARAQLHQDSRDVRLRRQWAELKRLGDLGVVQAVRDADQDFTLPRGQLLQRVELRLGAGPRLRDVCLDEPAGDARREQRLAVGDDSNS